MKKIKSYARWLLSVFVELILSGLKNQQHVVCGIVYSRKAEMMKQFCKCGCGAASYSCMDCPTIEACSHPPICKKDEEIKKIKEEK